MEGPPLTGVPAKPTAETAGEIDMDAAGLPVIGEGAEAAPGYAQRFLAKTASFLVHQAHFVPL
jgi:hypothetical protein